MHTGKIRSGMLIVVINVNHLINHYWVFSLSDLLAFTLPLVLVQALI